MYISKYIIMLILIILFNSCNQPEPASNAKGHIPYTQYLDGNIRSFDIINDTLFVASEDYGVVIYKVIDEDGKISLDSLSSTNQLGRPVSLDIADKSRSLIILDNYNHTYIGKVDFFEYNPFLSYVDCDTYQREPTFIDYNDKPIELIIPFRHKPTQNEADPLAWNTSSILRIKFEEEEYEDNLYYADCLGSDTLYKYLNYEIEDVYYNNQKLYLVNPDDTLYSIVSLNHEMPIDTFSVIDTLILDFKPLTIRGNDELVLIGLDNKQGCYIKLLGLDNENFSNFNIGLGYTIQDIQFSDQYIALSAGYGGSLIYGWDISNISNPDLRFLIGGIYSYKTVLYNDFNMIVGTKNGLHIYNIER